MDIDTKEIKVIERQATTLVDAAEKIEILNSDGMLYAGEMRRKIKDFGKVIKEKKESITKPMNEALKQVRSMFAPVEEMYEQAEEVLENKMLEYNQKAEKERLRIEKEAADKLAKAQKDLDAGKISEKKADKIVDKLNDELDAAPEAINKSDSFHTRVNKKFRIVSVKDIPLEFMVPDEVKIRQAMMKGIAVKGVEYYEEKTLI